MFKILDQVFFCYIKFILTRSDRKKPEPSLRGIRFDRKNRKSRDCETRTENLRDENFQRRKISPGLDP